jgi:hypothetical protein
MSLDERITNYATLIALVLVLLTLFTSQRASKLNEIKTDADRTEGQATQEMLLDAVIALATLLLFATGLPLLLDAIKHLHPFGHSGPLRGGFTITWLLLVVLVIWQALLWNAARKLRALIKNSQPVS